MESQMTHALSRQRVAMFLAGGLTRYLKQKNRRGRSTGSDGRKVE